MLPSLIIKKRDTIPRPQPEDLAHMVELLAADAASITLKIFLRHKEARHFIPFF